MDKRTAEEKIKEIAQDVQQAAKPIVEKAKPYVEKAEPYIDEIKTKAEPVIDDIKVKAEPVLKKAKQGTAKAKDVANNVKKDISKASARRNCKEEVFVQYAAHEVRTSDIVKAAKADYIAKGHVESDIKEIQVYIKPSDNAAYYVVNHAETGKIGFNK
ncbi:DUF6465 family protein [Butyrivibrio proteoclasticus]|uniref:DUF6465 family protein n=1 Tax=Butyrivibrio proteoclasticus TaxID=43305 RepID=UPI0006856A4D|nr:DUF6465 family protein [Butyrivibrio proteoclasticus]